jgi:hypothetical protein
MTRNNFASTFAPGRADLYNCRTGYTHNFRSSRVAKEHAGNQYRADPTLADWILMTPDRELYRSRPVEKHCGLAGYRATLTWDRFEQSELAEKLAPAA